MKVGKILILLVLFSGVLAWEPPRKQLSGDPSEFPIHSIPPVTNGALDKRSAFLEWALQKNENGFFGTLDLDVDSEKSFAFSIYSPLADSFTFTLNNPSGDAIPLQNYEYDGKIPVSDSNDLIPGKTYIFQNPVLGTWKLNTVSKAGVAFKTEPEISVILFNESPIRLYTHLNSYFTEVGEQIGLVTHITHQQKWLRGERPSVLKDVVTNAEMAVTTPSGQKVHVKMHDDGLHSDREASDGVYGATITADEKGIYLVSAEVKGLNSDGIVISRSTEHIISVVVDDLDYTGTGIAVPIDENRVKLYLEVNEYISDKRRAYAEVWGTDPNGREVAVCWISSMVNVETYDSKPTVALEFDLRWAARAGAKSPFFLKNAFIEELDSNVPVSERSMIKIASKVNMDHLVKGILRSGVPEITEEMKVGRRPKRFSLNRLNDTQQGLILIHGYCAGVNPWEFYKSWTNPNFFLTANENLSHDQYAMRVAKYAETKSFTSWSGIGHSQGGPVLVHLHNYYWTGMDTSNAPRLIQSVGSPYYGCTGAGAGANLIKIFGVGCGANTDLTTDGSSKWIAGIRPEVFSRVHYYTTTYELGKPFGDYCNIAVNLILQWPNDGTSEIDYCQLKGAHNMGNVEKQCHTTEMAYPAHYLDAKRNAEMNKHAY